MHLLPLVFGVMVKSFQTTVALRIQTVRGVRCYTGIDETYCTYVPLLCPHGHIVIRKRDDKRATHGNDCKEADMRPPHIKFYCIHVCNAEEGYTERRLI